MTNLTVQSQLIQSSFLLAELKRNAGEAKPCHAKTEPESHQTPLLESQLREPEHKN